MNEWSCYWLVKLFIKLSLDAHLLFAIGSCFQPIAPMPKPVESPASAMLKRCSAAVASLRACDAAELSSASFGQCKGQHAAVASVNPQHATSIQPQHAVSIQPHCLQDRPPAPLLAASPRPDVSAASQRQRTSVLAHILTHGERNYDITRYSVLLAI